MQPGRHLFSVVVFIALVLPTVAVPAAEMTETVLPNGMRVILKPVHTNPVVCSAVLVRAGVAWEPAGLSGSSHFLEHLLFNGTTSRTQEQLYADVDRIGAYNNATTRADHTLYMLLAPKEHLEAALEIQADMLLHSTLPPDKFEKEKGIVLEEMGRSANNAANSADEFFDSRIYAGSPYARPVLGTTESIRGLTRDAVLAYYRERYVPQRMVLLLIGDFDPERALDSIRARFGDAAPAGGQAVAPDRETPVASIPFDAEPNLYHQHLDAGRTYLRAAFPAPAEDSPDAAAFGLLVDLLGSGEAAPLDRALREGAEPAVLDYSLHHETKGGTGALVLSATLGESASPEEVVRTAAEAIVGAVREHRLDAEDLRLLHEQALTEDVTLGEQVHYDVLFRAHRFLQSSAGEVAARSASNAAVGLDVFGALVDRYLDPPRAVVTVSGPGQEDGAVTRLQPVVAASPTAVATRPAGGHAPRTVVLDNGLTLSVATEPGATVFAAHLIARNRSALEPDGRDGAAALVHRLLLRGTLARDAANLDRELQGSGATVKFFDNSRIPFDDYRTTPAYSFAIIEARADRTMQALRLFAEILQTPRFDPRDIEAVATQLADIARRNQESSRTVSQQLFREQTAPNHPLSRPITGTGDSLAGITRKEVTEFYARLFAPQNLILALRGGGSTEALLRRASEIFGGPGPGGGWAPAIPDPTPTASTALIAPPPATAGAATAERSVGKRQSYLRLGAVVEVAPEDRAALAAASLILSDRLQMDLRETQGLAYSIGAGLSMLGHGHELIAVSMGTAADNLERSETEIRRVVTELGASVSQEELDRIVAARKGRILMRRLPRQNQAMYDSLTLLYGEPSSGELEFLESLDRVTPNEVQAAAKRYMNPDAWVVAIAR